jgi:maltose alpha-D-glucosyltransferase/alpha-amylase
MDPRWYSEAVIYSCDVETFADSNGDGVGDFRGLIDRLDYLSRLGVTCLWLSPIHPTPGRDDGYDVTDFYGVDPRLGTLGDFAELLYRAGSRGIKVMIDLVVNHTSDEHPWFRSAVSSPDSPYRDWYLWSAEEPSDRFQGMVFPGEQKETWTWQEEAGAWYYHRFYDFQPDLNMANPAVRDEIKKIMAFWLRLGVIGFRIDAMPFIIEMTEPGNPDSPKDYDLLTDLRQLVQWRNGDSLLLAEANVEPDKLRDYFTDLGGSQNRIHMLFDFMLNGRLVLALARHDPEPIVAALRDTPTLPDGAQWATFLRNHDEIDLSRLPTGSARTRSTRSDRTRTCASTTGASGAGWPRCWATTADGSSWRTRCSSRCGARRCCDTATRSVWGRTSPCRAATRSAPRCSGRADPTAASPPRRRMTCAAR